MPSFLERLKSWREKRRLIKNYNERAYFQTLSLLDLQLMEEKRLQRQHQERFKLEKKILRSKAKDDYIS